jgi:hypothetical protein
MNREVYKLHTEVTKQQSLHSLYEFGIEQEEKLKPLLESFFDRKLYLYYDRFSIFDMHDANKHLIIEIKSLLHTKRKYPNTMIGMNKIKTSLSMVKRGINVFLIFNFSDKVCYYHLNNAGIKMSWVKDFKGKSYLYIPIDYLNDIENSSTIFLPPIKKKE